MFAGFILAVLASASNAASNVLQRKANKEEPPELSMSPRLIIDLVHRPAWLAGLVTVTLSFVLMAVALSLGRLAAVQPIVVLELPLTLVGASWVLGATLSKREWIASVVMSVGLAGLIASLDPQAGNNGAAPDFDWAVASILTAAAVAGVVFYGLRTGHQGRRAAFLGVATGMTFGFTAAFMKGMTEAFRQGGLVGGLTAWQTYVMVLCGLAGMYFMQNAVHAGRLIVAQPGITLADPVVAIVWGVVVFHESTRGGLALLAAVCSAALLAGGAVVLARSPLLEHEGATKEKPKASRGRRRPGRSGRRGSARATHQHPARQAS